MLFLVFWLCGCSCSSIELIGDSDVDQLFTDVVDQPLVDDEDGIEDPRCSENMAFVPEGLFVMGADPGEIDSESLPEHTVALSAYCIDLLEVTNADWKDCVARGACTEPSRIRSNTRSDYYTDSSYNSYPVMYINWYQASDYCEWKGKRLPTEAEWEKAARGGCEIGGDPETCDDPEDERMYPWGDDPPRCELIDICPSECCTDDTWEVGSKTHNTSPYGLFDMLGNVSEWVYDWYEREYYSTGGPPWDDPQGPTEGTQRIHRGHTYYYSLQPLTIRGTRMQPQYSTNGLGLRCVSDPLY